MSDLHAVHRAIRVARRRLAAQTWVTLTGWSLLAGLGAAAAAAAAQRLFALPMHWAVYAVIGGLALLVPAIIALSRQTTAAHLAVLIDDRLQLKDKLSTALYATTALADNPFAPQVIRDAQVAAASARVRDGFPVRMTRVWGWLPPVAAVFALLWVFLPWMDLAGLQQRRLAKQLQQEQVGEAQEKIVLAAAAIQQLQQDNESGKLDQIDPELAMKEAANLTQRELTNPEYRQKAAAKLSAVEEKLAQAEQQKAKEFEALQNAMSRIDQGKPGPADRFADALRRGDFDAAKDALQAMADQVDQMSPQQQAAAKEQLENIAKQLDEAAKQAQGQQQQGQQQIQQQLSNAGLSQQQINEAQQQGYNQEHLQQLLQRQGMSQSQAQQMAQQIQQQQQQSQSQGQSQSQCQGLSQSLSQMAQAMGAPKQGQNGQQGQQGQSNMQSSSWQAQQQVNDMARMQQQLQQLRQSQSQMRQAMNQLGNCNSPGNGQGQQQQGLGNKQGGGGQGGQKAGTGDGGNPFGQERTYQPDQVEAIGHIGQGEGRVIASWMQQGEAAAGEAQVGFNTAVTEARDQAERAIADDRVPARYHKAVGDYFRQMPQTVDEVKRAPAAPR